MGGDDDDKVEGFEPEVKEEKRVKYVCIAKCYWKKLYKVGDIIMFAGEHKMLKHFKVRKRSDSIEEENENEPVTLAGLQAKASGSDNDKFIAGQAPVPGAAAVPAAEGPAEEDVEEGAEKLLE